LWKISQTNNRFIFIAGTGLVSIFALQALINLSVNLGLFPPKGMTLPFISYGGSSAIALGFLSGFLLCLSRKHPYNY
jgi:cell division protein FtsW